MNYFVPYGLIAVGMSMYVFSRIRRQRSRKIADRVAAREGTRQAVLNRSLGQPAHVIILYEPYMEAKMQQLQLVGEDRERDIIFYLDAETKEKWIREPIAESMSHLGDAQLRKVLQFSNDE